MEKKDHDGEINHYTWRQFYRIVLAITRTMMIIRGKEIDMTKTEGFYLEKGKISLA